MQIRFINLKVLLDLEKLWVHEILRIFYDRLINDTDKDFLIQALKHNLSEETRLTLNDNKIK